MVILLGMIFQIVLWAFGSLISLSTYNKKHFCCHNTLKYIAGQIILSKTQELLLVKKPDWMHLSFKMFRSSSTHLSFMQNFCYIQFLLKPYHILICNILYTIYKNFVMSHMLIVINVNYPFCDSFVKKYILHRTLTLGETLKNRTLMFGKKTDFMSSGHQLVTLDRSPLLEFFLNLCVK